MNYWQPVEQPDRPPSIPSLPDGWFLSLSHSKGHITLALHNTPVGVDIEHRRQRANLPQLAEMICSPMELQHLDIASDCGEFYRLWCRKEAWYKLLPAHDQQTTSLSELCTGDENEPIKFLDLKVADFQVCLAISVNQPWPEIKTTNVDRIKPEK